MQLGSPRRLATIYRTNLRTARAAGQWARIERTKGLRPYLLYLTGPSREPRPLHQTWAGTILPVDDPWWRTHYPPNGWGCKCHVRQVAEAARLGGVTARPRIQRRTWRNTRTGEVSQVPRGIDPGWDYNPGAQRSPPQKRPARIVPGQRTAQDWGLPRLAARTPAPPPRPQAASPEAARASKDAALGLTDATPQRVVATPAGPVVLDRQQTDHIVEKFGEHREQFADRILPTLTAPDEVWLTQYTTGPRLHYLRAFAPSPHGFVVVEEDPKAGPVVVTFVPRRTAENRRVGDLIVRQR